MTERAYEWDNVLGWNDDGVTQSRGLWIVIAETLEEAREKICRSPRFVDDPARIRKEMPRVRELERDK